MEHLDEGTVHAWLDGALSADEGARIERHLTGCADCSAMVAEARGLIAASTRILGALDEAPQLDGGRWAVDGRGAGGAPALPQTPLVARRPWWLRGQFTAAAAVALIALGTAVVVNGRGGEGAGDFGAAVMAPAEREVQAATSDSFTTSPPSAMPSDVPTPSRPPSPSDLPAARGARADAADVADAARTQAQKEARPPAQEQAQRSESTRELKAAGARAANEVARSREGKPLPTAPLPAPPLAPPRVAARALSDSAPATLEARDGATLRKESPATGARPGDSARVAGAAAARSLSPALRPEEIAKRERERVLGEPPLRLESAVTTGAAAAAAAAAASAEGRTRVEDVVACWILERTTAAREAGVPERVEFLARVVGEEKGRRMYAARPLGGAGGDASAEWRWTIGERGEVTLVRGVDEDAARFPIAITLASRTGETSVGRRDSCPSR